MLFNITKQIGEIEFEKLGINTSSLTEYIKRNPSVICGVSSRVEEIIPFRFQLNNNGFMQFQEIMLPISNIEGYKDRVLYKKGRENDGDYTFTSVFYLSKINQNKPIEENLYETAFTRIVRGKITKTKKLEEYEKENNQEYINILQPFMLFCNFIKYVCNSKSKETDFHEIIIKTETYRHKNNYPCFLSEEDILSLNKLKGKKLVNYINEKIDIKSIYDYYYEQYNINTLFQMFSDGFVTDIGNKNKDYINKNRLITIVFGDAENPLFMSDISIIGELLLETLIDTYSSGNENVGEGQCAICGEHKKVYGNAINNLKAPYNQFTAFKNIYCSNGLNPNRMWANFPVCLDCILKLEKGRPIIQNKPFRNYYKGLIYYILPYTRNENTFKDFYERFKVSQENIETTEELSYIMLLNKLVSEGKIEILDRLYNEGIKIDEDIGIYFLFTVEKQEATCIIKTIENSSLNKITLFNKTLKDVANQDFFKYYYTKDGLKERSNNMKLHYIFLEECKNLFKYSIAKGLNDNFNQKEFLDFIKKILVLEPINLQDIVRRFVDLLTYLYRNTSEEEAFFKFMDFMYIYCVLNKLQGGANLNMKVQYEVIYSGENRNFVEKMEECISDLGIEKNIEKAAFILGYLTKKIVREQQNKNLSGSFIEILNRKINNDKDIVKIYNKVADMILNKYKDNLSYLNPILQLCSEYISDIRREKVDKDYCTFALIQGYNMESRFVKVKEEDK